jgi:hypothetical protein
MIRKVMLLTLMALFVATAATADFTNGGFETGDFSGWTKNGGSFTGSYSYSGDPGKSAIVTLGNDPIIASGGGTLSMVYNGTYAARVNDGDAFYTGWGGYHFSTISQSVVWSDPHIYFAWAAVLQEPGHPHAYEPNFQVILKDETTGTTLYSKFFASDTIPASLLKSVTASDGYTWKYTDWQVVDLDTSAVMGDTLTLTLLASDCGYGGHSGYAYLDGFGAVVPPVTTPIPGSLLLLGSGLLGLIGIRRRQS